MSIVRVRLVVTPPATPLGFFFGGRGATPDVKKIIFKLQSVKLQGQTYQKIKHSV